MPPRLPIATSISVKNCLVINVTPSKIINETIQEITTRILEAKKNICVNKIEFLFYFDLYMKYSKKCFTPN